MPRMTTAVCSAAAAGLTALAVMVAGPALGAGSPSTGPDKQAGPQNGPTPQALQACLQEHGATGVPGDERDGRALKEWIAAHQEDASAKDALKACDVLFVTKDGPSGPGGCASPAGPKAAPSAHAREKARRVDAARKT